MLATNHQLNLKRPQNLQTTLKNIWREERKNWAVKHLINCSSRKLIELSIKINLKKIKKLKGTEIPHILRNCQNQIRCLCHLVCHFQEWALLQLVRMGWRKWFQIELVVQDQPNAKLIKALWRKVICQQQGIKINLNWIEKLKATKIPYFKRNCRIQIGCLNH